MSLLSQWNSVRNKLDSALNKSSDIHGSNTSGDMDTNSEAYLKSLFENKSKWRCSRHSVTSSSAPTIGSFNTRLCAATQLRSHDTNQDWGWANSYIGIRECYVYCSQDYSLETTFWTDDAGRIYLNGSSVATSTSCTSQAVTLNFKKGLNHICIMFQEGSGGDAAYLGTNIFNKSWVKWGFANYKR